MAFPLQLQLANHLNTNAARIRQVIRDPSNHTRLRRRPHLPPSCRAGWALYIYECNILLYSIIENIDGFVRCYMTGLYRLVHCRHQSGANFANNYWWHMTDQQPDEMTLSWFVEQALLDICKAVSNAQIEITKLRTTGQSQAAINPVPIDPSGFNWKDVEREIEFDILVTNESGNTGTASAGLKMFNLGAGLGTERTKTSSIANRLKFSVPVIFTGMEIRDYQYKPRQP
nr:hypothetical protein [uncultured Dongia sp.]